MTASPLVSVVIPAFNAERFIDDAMRSVVVQTYKNLEILVADDASTDGTRERVRRYDADPRVRLIEAAARAGRPSVPRNRALALATGDCVAFLDADDIWTPRKIEDQMRAFAAHPDLLLVYSVLRGFGGGLGLSSSSYGLKPWPTRASVAASALEAANTIPSSSVLARRRTLVDLGGFDEDPELNAVEDFDLWLRVSRQGPIAFIPRVHGYYRVHAAGISRDPSVQRRRAEYLVRKRGLSRFTFREFAERPMPLRIARNVLDIVMTAWLQGKERVDRSIGAPVPLRRA